MLVVVVVFVAAVGHVDIWRTIPVGEQPKIPTALQ
jgi:hypothetical protein